MRKNRTNYDPVASKSNTIIFGKTRFQLLTDRMVRLEWSETGEFEDHSTLAVVNRKCPDVSFTKEENGTSLVLKTDSLLIDYNDNGNRLSSENISIKFDMDGNEACWNPEMEDTENLGGTIRTLDGVDGDKQAVWDTPNLDYIPNEKGKGQHGNPSQSLTQFLWDSKSVDLGKGLLSKSGWSIIDDSANITICDETEWVKERPEGKKQDLYFMAYGHDYKQALEDGAEVFGRQPIPPRYALGYWWSRYWAYTDQEIEELVDCFDAMKVPIDVMVVDMDWHLEGWTGYTWDKRYFPDPDEFLSELKRRNMKITLNLHPADGVGKLESQFEDMAKALGQDKDKIDKVEFNITDPKYMDNYFKILHHPEEKRGVDFWWMDWQQGESTAMKGLDTLPWINHLHWQDMEKNPERGNKRPLIFSRFGGIGAGRYCVGFSGDTHSNWGSLAFQPHFTATASNVLYGYWSHDIGGHIPGEIEPELYTRWMQYGTYSPILRTHTSKNPLAERRVWEYPSPYNKVMMDTIRKRYEMVPYIYSENRKAFDSGVSLCRPMYYDYPECKEAYKAKSQYMFGDHMLVAPVTEKLNEDDEMVEVSVWLPEGKWFDTALGAIEEGGKLISKKYLIDEVPVFVRPGTVIPGQTDTHRLDDKSIKNLLFTIYSGDKGTYNLYEDDGITTSYQDGNYAEITLSHNIENGVRKITIDEVKGEYEGFESIKNIEIRVAGEAPPKSVQLAGKNLEYSFRKEAETWSYNGATAETVIYLNEQDISAGLKIDIEQNSECDSSLAYGLKGLMNRMKKINYYNTIATTFHIIHEKERLGVEIAQAGNRISRNPEIFADEVKAAKAALKEMVDLMTTLRDYWNGRKCQGTADKFSYCKKALALLKNTV